jgi:hypothetical protein
VVLAAKQIPDIKMYRDEYLGSIRESYIREDAFDDIQPYIV